jgi:nicotinate dehydrogenase subunit A
MGTLTLRINGAARTIDLDDPNEPLLYVLRNDLGLHGAKFGCGLVQCGACTVLLGGRPVRSCVTPVRAAAGQDVLTVEGLGSPAQPDPVQAAFIGEAASAPVAAALGNALFDATGVRFRTVPLRPERVLAGMAGAPS